MKVIVDSQSSSKEGAIVLRFDAGDNVISGLRDFCDERQVEAAQFYGIGSTGDLILSYYNLKTKEYEDKQFKEDLEVLALNGNIGFLYKNHGGECETIVHAHGLFSDRAMTVIGGHVKSLVVSATCEIILREISGVIERKFDEKTGLNLMIAESERNSP